MFEKNVPKPRTKVPEYLQQLNTAISSVYTLYYYVVAENVNSVVSFYCNDFLSLESDTSYTLELLSAFNSEKGTSVTTHGVTANASYDRKIYELTGSLNVTYSDSHYYNYYVDLLLTLNCKNNVVINYTVRVPPSILTT
jgi:hypothetical protein